MSFIDMSSRSQFSYLGYGLGLRSQHFKHILKTQPQVDWFEIISENFIDSQGWPRHVINQIAEQYPVVMHGVSMSIGSTDPLNISYLKKLKVLAKEINAQWVSDHLCWTGVLGKNTHDLLPLPLTEETLYHVVERIKTVQDILERPLVLENPSSYLQFNEDTFSECDFIREMANESDCRLLLDINNVYVSSFNHGFDPLEYIQSLPIKRIVQFHLAGHHHKGTHIIDTHDNFVVEQVWELYKETIKLTGEVSTLLEWDSNIPEFSILKKEVLKAKKIFEGGEIPDSPVTENNEESLPNKLFITTPDWER
jgi:uncharacterized protein (UPF0276 family)